MFDGKPFGWPRVQDFGFGQPGIGDFPYPLPCGLVSLATSFKRAPPDFRHTASECHERRQVCRHGVIGEETPDHLLKPLSLLRYGTVPSPVQLLPDFLELCTAAVAPGLPFELENPLAGSAADQREPQEVEGLCTALGFWDTGLKPTLPEHAVEGAAKVALRRQDYDCGIRLRRR